MVLKSQSSLLVSIDSLDYAKSKLSVRPKNEDPESEELKELIDTIRVNGVQDPIAIKPKAGGRYDVVNGNRRLAAAKALKMKYIPATILEVDWPDGRLAAFGNNLGRKNYNAMEKARVIALCYNDFGIPPEIAIQKVKYMHNLKQRDPEEYDQLASGRTQFVGKNVLSDTEPSPEFLDVFKRIPFSANYQYQYLQMIVKIPVDTLEILDKNPKLGMDKAVALTHSKLAKYPEVVRQSLAEQIVDPNMNVKQARHLVDQTLADLEEGRTTITEDGNIDYGYGSGKGYRSDPEENVDTKQDLEKGFNLQLIDMNIVLRTAIGKILHIQVPRGGIGFNPEHYGSAIKELKKSLQTLKKDDKVFCATDASIMMQICKTIVDSVR